MTRPTAVDPRIRCVRSHLADGRELLYFDDIDSSLPPARAADERQLAARPATPELRLDVLTGDWIAVASARQGRVMLPPAHLDPLAPQSPGNPSEIPGMYDVAVFENRSPSFGPSVTAADASEPAPAPPVPTAPPLHAARPDLSVGLEQRRPAVGRCEVVCFSPLREGSISTLGERRVRTVIEAWAHRTAELSQLPAVRQVFPFENRGEAIGVTLHHPHGQIYAYPYITPRTQRLLAMMDSYGPALFADVLDRELAGPRVLVRGKHWSAFVPFAARWPVEIHLLPHRDVPDFAHTSLEERDELAHLYPLLLRGVDALYGSPTPYIAAWHQAPVGAPDGVRLTLQITSPRRAADKYKFLAGSEAAMGAWVADVAPESAAAALRDAIASADDVHAPHEVAS